MDKTTGGGEKATQKGADANLVERFISGLPLFAQVSSEARSAIVGRLSAQLVRAGEVVLREGDVGDSLFIVQSGRLRVTVGEPERVIGELGKGEVVGEMALLSDEPRSATVLAVRDSTLLRLESADFTELVADHPGVLRAVSSVIVDRLRSSITGVPKTQSTADVVAVISAASPGDSSQLAEHLSSTFESMGEQVAVLRAGSGVELDRVEEECDVVLLICGDHDDPWTLKSVRQADVILLVGPGGQSTAMKRTEEALGIGDGWTGADVQLVFTHTAGSNPRSTRRVLSALEKRRHHHVCIAEVESLARLARALRGRAIVLVLGGGGARGLAHLGVVKAFADKGVGIDGIVATSAGTLVGMGVSLGMDLADIHEGFREYFSKSVVDWTFPSVSVAAGSRITGELQKLGDGHDLEDTWIDFSCVSTDLTNDELVLHTTGPIWEAVRASISIPGVFPPFLKDGRVLVDGGLADNVPVASARRRHPGATIVAVDVGRDTRLEPKDLPAGGIVGAKHGLTRLRHRGDKLGLSAILARVTELSTTYDINEAADIGIRPDIGHFGTFEFDRIDEACDLGYEAAMTSLKDFDY
ncbi:MAG: cyclic nucleotide-binding and patatin-like phospholipase domain-containing protein [Acidimicrobiales bacterium]